MADQRAQEPQPQTQTQTQAQGHPHAQHPPRELADRLRRDLSTLKRDVRTSFRLCSRDFGVLGRELLAALAQGQQRERAASDALAHERAARGKLETRLAEVQGNIRVMCRVRPMRGATATSSSEEEENASPDRRRKRVQVDSAQELSVFSPVDGALYRSFSFSRVFHEQHSQQTIFKEVAPMVLSAVAGHHACVFAYGQTGAGKTHTMQGGEGSESDRGLYVRATDLIYATLAQQQHVYDFAVSVRLVEVYNEEIYDLLGESSPASATTTTTATAASSTTTSAANGDRMSPPGTRGSLGSVMGCHVGATSMCGGKQPTSAPLGEIRHGEHGVYLKNVQSVPVSSAEQVYEAINRARTNRSASKSDRSSRSHSVLLLDVQRTSKANGEVDTGRLALVDLAGSERLPKTAETSPLTLRESQHINKSLAAVGDVLAALLAKEKHIPFRNSKLTHLLQDSLSGSANRTLLLVHVSPMSADVNETVNSLKFASRVSQTQGGNAKRPERTEISRLNGVISNQASQIQALQEKLAAELEKRKKYEKRLEEYRQKDHRRKAEEDEAKKLAQQQTVIPATPEQQSGTRRWSLYARKESINNYRGLNGIENVAENILRGNASSSSSSSLPLCLEGSTAAGGKPSGISPPMVHSRRLSLTADRTLAGLPPVARRTPQQPLKRKSSASAEVRSILKKQRRSAEGDSDNSSSSGSDAVAASKQVSFDLPQTSAGASRLPPRQPVTASRAPTGAIRVLAPTRTAQNSPARRVVSTPAKRNKPKWNGGWR